MFVAQLPRNYNVMACVMACCGLVVRGEVSA